MTAHLHSGGGGSYLKMVLKSKCCGMLGIILLNYHGFLTLMIVTVHALSQKACLCWCLVLSFYLLGFCLLAHQTSLHGTLSLPLGQTSLLPFANNLYTFLLSLLRGKVFVDYYIVETTSYL